jgi:hypothetical protein
MLEQMTSYELSEWKVHLRLSDEETKRAMSELRKG